MWVSGDVTPAQIAVTERLHLAPPTPLSQPQARETSMGAFTQEGGARHQPREETEILENGPCVHQGDVTPAGDRGNSSQVLAQRIRHSQQIEQASAPKPMHPVLLCGVIRGSLPLAHTLPSLREWRLQGLLLSSTMLGTW